MPLEPSDFLCQREARRHRRVIPSSPRFSHVAEIRSNAAIPPQGGRQCDSPTLQFEPYSQFSGFTWRSLMGNTQFPRIRHGEEAPTKHFIGPCTACLMKTTTAGNYSRLLLRAVATSSVCLQWLSWNGACRSRFLSLNQGAATWPAPRLCVRQPRLPSYPIFQAQPLGRCSEAQSGCGIRHLRHQANRQ